MHVKAIYAPITTPPMAMAPAMPSFTLTAPFVRDATAVGGGGVLGYGGNGGGELGEGMRGLGDTGGLPGGGGGLGAGDTGGGGTGGGGAGGGEGGGEGVGEMEREEKETWASRTGLRMLDGHSWSSQSARPSLPQRETTIVMP